MVRYGKLVAGIFSREDSRTYDWLTRMVLDMPDVKDVRPVQISSNWSDFADEVLKCSFAILFHSKTRGRLNVTNVTDSLYDRELEHLFRVFGRKKVIVVIGDVEDNSEEQKKRILREQPDIRTKARGLILFNTINDQAPFQGLTMLKLRDMIKSIAHKSLFMKPFFWVILVAVGLIVIIVVVIVEAEFHGQASMTTMAPVPNTTAANATVAPMPNTTMTLTSQLFIQLASNTTKLP